MAVHTLPVAARAVTYSPHVLSAARAAFVSRCNDAARRAMRQPGASGMPYRLVSTSCFLAAQGVAAAPCSGECFFNWDLSVSRRYLDGLSPDAQAEEVEAGRAAMFDGRQAIARANALSRAWDAMADAATATDGSYERARDHFNALNAAVTGELHHG